MGLSAQEIVNAGATRLQTITTDRNTLSQIQIVYASAVTSTWWLPVAAACAATLSAQVEWSGEGSMQNWTRSNRSRLAARKITIRKTLLAPATRRGSVLPNLLITGYRHIGNMI